MFIAGYFVFALAKVLDTVLFLLGIIIVVRALISWVNPDPYNFIVQLLNKITAPVLSPIRKILPLDLRSGIDVSALAAILIIMFLRFFLVASLLHWSSIMLR